MSTQQSMLDEYKKAIQLKFEEEKTKKYSNFLLQPSRANLRKLCLERMKNNLNVDDLNSFNLFLGFEFNLSQLNKLKAQNDKFRPIETFFKKETDLSELEAVNVAAILVDFQPRPFGKFTKLDRFESEKEKEDVKEYLIHDAKEANSGHLKQENVLNIPLAEIKKKSLKKKLTIGVLVFFGVFSISYTAKNLLFPKKECMKWTKDHYQRVDCINENQGIASYEIIKPYDDREFRRKKLNVCDTTNFYISKRPKVWYSKKNNVVEFFNMDGVNPENDAELKKVSKTIIEKYVPPCQ
jgi:hypothetical protein